MRRATSNFLSLSLLIATTFSACAVSQRMEPVPTTYLTDVDTTKKLENLPFQHSWVLEAVNRKDYNAVYFPPVKTEALAGSGWEKSRSSFVWSEQGYLEHASKIATYFRERVIEEVSKTANGRFKIVDAPGPGVVVFQIALTELEFAHPVMSAGSMAVPIPATGNALAAIADPHASFAARLTDGKTGKLIATAADRQFPPVRIMDFNKLTVESSAREIVSKWAVQLAGGLDKGRLGIVEGNSRFSLMPW